MSGRYNTALKHLTLLQDLIKKDPQSYKTEFVSQYRHFQQTLRVFQLQPAETDVSRLLELVSFVSQLSYLFPKETSNFGPNLMEILRVQASKLDPEVRLSFVKALILLRNRKVLNGLELTQLFFDHLLKVHDKTLRKFIYTSLVAHAKLLNTAKGKRDPKLSNQIQNYIFTRMKDAHSITVRTSLMVNMECFRKQLWKDAKTANAIAECCFNRNTKIQVTAMRFFLGRSDNGEDGSDVEGSDSDAETQGAAETRTLKEITVGYKAGKKTKKRQKAMERAKNAINKDGKKKKDRISSQVCNVLAIQHLYDPQEFAERLFKQLEKSTDRFEVKLMQMSLISRVIGVHQLLVLGFYNYLHRYLQPHQREVTKILLYAAQASHEHVVPDVIETMVRVIVNNFVTDRNSNEVMTVGLNAVREILHGCPFAIGEDLLRDLAEYKKYKNKNVSMAAKSLIQLFRTLNPQMLHRKDRGRPTEARKELRVKEFGKGETEMGVPGAECLEEEEEEKERENSDSDEDGSWIDMPQSDNEEEPEGNPENEESMEDPKEISDPVDGENAEISNAEKAQLVSSARILTQEEFRKIHAHQLKKQLDPARGKGKKRKSEMTAVEELEFLECSSERGMLPKLSDIERLHKKPKQDKASRLESVEAGREGREKFGRKIPKGPHCGRTNKQVAKKKNFMMIRHKSKKKNKRSYQDKQRSLQKYLTHQKKMK